MKKSTKFGLKKTKQSTDEVGPRGIVGNVSSAQRRNYTPLLIVALIIIPLFTGFLVVKHLTKPDPNQELTYEQIADLEIENAKPGEERAQAHMSKAALYIESNDYKKALAEYLAADKTWPNQARVNGSIGNTYFLLKDKDNSIKYFRRAIKLAESDPNSTSKSNVPLWKDSIERAQKNDFALDTTEANQ